MACSMRIRAHDVATDHTDLLASVFQWDINITAYLVMIMIVGPV